MLPWRRGSRRSSLRVLAILARHGTTKYADALESLLGFYRAQLPSVSHEVLVVDNAVSGAAAGLPPGVIAGSNRHWEFSAWDEGLAHVGARALEFDLVHLVTSAFRTLYTRYIDRFDERMLETVTGRRAAVGHIDCYNEPVELAGYRSQSWIRSSFVFLPPYELSTLGSLVGVPNPAAFFSKDPARPFSADAPICDTYRRYIVDWLTGPGTGQGTTWHSTFALTAETLPLFEAKALAILNEHMLAIRLRRQGCALVDATWLATRAARRARSLDAIPHWREQLARRDTDRVVLSTYPEDGEAQLRRQALLETPRSDLLVSGAAERRDGERTRGVAAKVRRAVRAFQDRLAAPSGKTPEAKAKEHALMNRTEAYFERGRKEPSSIYSDTDYLLTHLTRFRESYLFIERLLQRPGARILELGERGPFTRIVSDLVPGIRITNTQGDLRGRFLDAPELDGSFDLILCMELLEHVKDIEERDFMQNIQFTGNGILHILKQCRRLLAPSGMLFISTPNVNGYQNFIKMAGGRHPFAYEPHVREHTMSDIVSYLEKAGLGVDAAETKDVWFYFDRHVKSMIDELCSKLSPQAHDVGRGDCMFILAKKASA